MLSIAVLLFHPLKRNLVQGISPGSRGSGLCLQSGALRRPGRGALDGGPPSASDGGFFLFVFRPVRWLSFGDFAARPRVFKIEHRTARLGSTGALVRPRTKAPVRVGGRGNLLDDVGMAWQGGAGLRSLDSR